MNEPLWLLIEKKVCDLSAGDVSGDRLESTIQRVAGELDEAGHNVSQHGGNLLQLRWALDERVRVGRPLLDDFEKAIAALTLDSVSDIWQATTNVLQGVGEAWPRLMDSQRRADIEKIVVDRRLALLTEKAKSLPEDEGIRYMIVAEVEFELITKALDITAEKLAEVNASVEAEKAERARVQGLLKDLEGKPDDEKIKKLLEKSVADELTVELAGVDQAAIDLVRKAMEAELAEQKKREEEEAARKAAEAAGPSLDDIEPDQMLEYIESIREILEFSDVEDEIRTMCGQSDLPSALVDIAVSEPDKLDELEAKAEG